METYIILGSYTKEGVDKIKDSPARTQAVREATEAAGGKFLKWYLTMGRYDFVVIVEAPSAEVAVAQLLTVGAQGKVRTETLRAFTEDEFKDIVKRLP